MTILQTFDLLDASRYKSKEFYDREPELKRALDQIRDGFFSPEDPNHFADIIKHLLDWNDQ